MHLKKTKLKQQWVDFITKTGISEPLNVELVFNLISSRILLSSKGGDDAFTELLAGRLGYYARLAEGDAQVWWRSVLQGLLVLGANPVKILEKFSQFRVAGEAEEPSVTAAAIHVMYKFAEIILIHLQQRAAHLDTCVAELDRKFDRLLEATRQFAAQLDEDVFSPNLPTLLGMLSKNIRQEVGTARTQRAKLFASIVQVIYIVLNDALKEEDVESLKTREGDSEVTNAWRNYDHYKKQCEAIPFLYRAGWGPFKKLIAAVNELDTSLQSLGATRAMKHVFANATMDKAAAEAKIRELQLDKVQDREKIEKAAAQVKTAEEQVKIEAEARQAAEEQLKIEVEERKTLAAQLEKHIKRDIRRKLEPRLETLTTRTDLLKDCDEIATDYAINPERVYEMMTDLIRTEPAFNHFLGCIAPPEISASAAEAGFFSPGRQSPGPAQTAGQLGVFL